MIRSKWSLAFLAFLVCAANGWTVAAELPYAPYAPAVAARFAEPAVRYDTPGLQGGRETFTSNDELRAALRALAAAPKGPRLVAAGRSQSGLAIEALHFSSGPGHPAVLLVGRRQLLGPLAAMALVLVQQKFFSLGGYVAKIVLGSVLVLTLGFYPQGLSGLTWPLAAVFRPRLAPPVPPAP